MLKGSTITKWLPAWGPRGFVLFGLLLTVAPLVGQTTIDGTRYVQMFQFSPDGKTVVCYTTDGVLLSWDLASRKLLSSRQTKTDHRALDPQGKLLSLVGDAGGIRVIDVVSNREVKFLEGADFYKFELSPDGKTLAFAEGNQLNPIKLWDVTTGKEKASIERSNPDDHLGVMLFSPDGATLAGLSRSITLWSVSTGKQSRSIAIDAGLLRMAFTPNGKMICVSGFDNIKPSFIKCFEVLSGREVLSVPAEASSPFAFSPDGTVLALTRHDEGVFLINMATGKEMAKITTSAYDSSFTQMSFSPNGKLLAVGSTDGLVLFDPLAGKELFILTQP